MRSQSIHEEWVQSAGRRVDEDAQRFIAAARQGRPLPISDFALALERGLLPEGANVLVEAADTAVYEESAWTEITDLMDRYGIPSVDDVAGRNHISPVAVVAQGNSYRVQYRGDVRQVKVLRIADYDDPGQPIGR